LKIMKLLNQRPRKTLGYKTPETLFFTKFEKLALAG
jgi:IS30 family transposase